jgi:hypothetical protein
MEDMPDEDFYESEIMRPARKSISLLRIHLREFQDWVEDKQCGPMPSAARRNAFTRVHLNQVAISAAAALDAINDALASSDAGKEEPDVTSKLEG